MLEEKRESIKENHEGISIQRQCELVGLARSLYYYHAKSESDLNLELMRLIDEQYTKTPFYGVPRMTAWLRKRKGCSVNRKRIKRLMRLMGPRAIHPKRRTSKSSKDH